MWARQNQQAFTIVELLVVIVGIAILAAITLVAFNGVQVRAKNAAISANASNWRKALLAYHQSIGSLPSTTSTTAACISQNLPANTDFAAGVCSSEVGISSADTAFINSVNQVARVSIPSSDYATVTGTNGRIVTKYRGLYFSNALIGAGPGPTPHIVYFLQGSASACGLGSASTTVIINTANDGDLDAGFISCNVLL